MSARPWAWLFAIASSVGCGHFDFTRVSDDALTDSGLPGMPVPQPQSHVWSRVYNGAGFESVNTFGFDDTGSLHVSGGFIDTVDFGSGPRTATRVAASHNAYAVAYDAVGSVVWLRTVDSYLRNQRGTVAPAGGLLQTGQLSIDATWSPGVQINGDSLGDLYFVRYGATGDADAWLVSAAGTQEGHAAAIGGDDEVVIGMTTQPVQSGNVTLDGSFVAAFDRTGKTARWSITYCSGFSCVSSLPAITVTTDGGIAIGGRSSDPSDFGTGVVADGANSFYVVKLSSTGAAQWGQRGFGGPNTPAVAATPDGGVYVAGSTRGVGSFAGVPTSAASDAAFVARLKADGAVAWLHTFGASGSISAYHVALDPAGYVYATGALTGTVDFGGTQLTSNGDKDVWIAAFDPDGAILWATSYGGTGAEAGIFVAVYPPATVCTAGSFDVSFDAGGGSIAANGGPGVFVACHGS